MACQCDVCGRLYRAEEFGTLRLEVNITGVGGWSDVELCVDCTKDAMRAIGPALDGLEEATEKGLKKL